MKEQVNKNPAFTVDPMGRLCYLHFTVYGIEEFRLWNSIRNHTIESYIPLLKP